MEHLARPLIDVAATADNALCARYYAIEDDGLAHPWTDETVWLNPPFSQIASWVEKSYLESLAGATVVMLVPVRSDTRWWHNYAVHAEVRFLKGRLRFGDAKSSAPFPSALLVFRNPLTETVDQEGGPPPWRRPL